MFGVIIASGSFNGTAVRSAEVKPLGPGLVSTAGVPSEVIGDVMGV